MPHTTVVGVGYLYVATPSDSWLWPFKDCMVSIEEGGEEKRDE